MAVDKSDNMGMVKALEDVDLRREVIFEFLVELSQVDRLDGYVGPMFRMYALIDGSKASSPNLIQPCVSTYRQL